MIKAQTALTPSGVTICTPPPFLSRRHLGPKLLRPGHILRLGQGHLLCAHPAQRDEGTDGRTHLHGLLDSPLHGPNNTKHPPKCNWQLPICQSACRLCAPRLTNALGLSVHHCICHKMQSRSPNCIVRTPPVPWRRASPRGRGHTMPSVWMGLRMRSSGGMGLWVGLYVVIWG